MNKKLFALLTSAAMMAACAPSVFADDTAAAKEATLKFVADKTTVAPGEDVNFDVYVSGDVLLTTLQFTLDVTGGEIASDVQVNARTGNKEDKAFKFDPDGTALLQWGTNGAYTGATLADMTEEQLKPFNGAAKDYMVLGFDTNQIGGNPKEDTADNQIKIGSISVKAGESGEVKMDSTTLAMGNYLGGKPGDENRDVLNATIKTEPAVVTIGGAAPTSSEEESKAPESSATESKAPESSATESKAPASSTKAADSSSKAATTNNNSTTTKSTSSTAKTNNTNDNKNTGAASTAAVALVGAAAALVVVSKKRK